MSSPTSTYLDTTVGAPQPIESAVDSTHKLPRRDLYLLPLLSFATILVLFTFAEVGSRLAWPEADYEKCRVQDATDPRRAVPNCDVTTKAPEGPWMSYHINSCGMRTFATCGPKPPSVIRIATLGASMTMGKNAPIHEIWPERLGQGIAEFTGRKVEVENLGWELLSPLHCYRQIPDVIALQPAMVVYAVNPFDLSRGLDKNQLAHRDDPASTFPKLKVDLEEHESNLQNILKAVQNAFAGSRASVMAQHFVFSNPATFLKVYMADGHRADYARQPFTPLWQDRFHDFALILHDMKARLDKAGIPFIVVALPARSQVALLYEKESRPNVDPYAYERELAKICKDMGVTYVPTLDAFAKTPQGDKLFYIFDTHITGEGHAVVAREILKKCLNGSIPAFQKPQVQTAAPLAIESLAKR